MDSNDANREIFSLSQVKANSQKHLKEETNTMKKSLLPVVLFIIVVTCVFSTVGSGNAQKGKPPAPIPLKVSLAGNANAPDGYRIVSDGRGYYVDGEHGVTARIEDGRLVVDPITSTVPAPRYFWFNFSAKIADGVLTNPWGGLPDWKPIDSHVQINSISSIPVGETEERSGGIGQLYAGTGRKQTMYRIAFNPDTTGPFYTTVNFPNTVSTFSISHPDCNTWVITPKEVDYADYGYGAGSGAVAAFLYMLDSPQSTGQYLMPMQMTLTRKTQITCP